jgi:2-haloalkanoic acid dehalogenase type II
MKRDFDVVTFDCYGTLIDWESGIAEAIAAEAERAGVSPGREAIIEAYHRKEPAAEETWIPYREVLSRTAREVAEDLGFEIAPGREGFLADSLASWRPFPDVGKALEKLKGEGLSLGILSNVDDDLLASSLRHFPVEFDLIVTAEQVRSYKPAPEHFVAARARIGDRLWVHAAQSHFHDVAPARDLEIPVAWINRKGEEQKTVAVPEWEFRDLEHFAEWIVGGAEPSDVR